MSVSPLVSVEWLADHYLEDNVVVIDACWYMPDSGRDPRKEHEEQHIPGARFFDIDAVADLETELPHMLPDDGRFTKESQALGINDDSHIVVYHKDMPSAARAWWTFRTFGHQHVSILDGGMNAWLSAGHPVTGDPTSAGAGNFTAKLDSKRVASLHDILEYLNDPNEQILDVRPADRFFGRVPEPRAGMRSGHMPGAKNLPFPQCYDGETGLFKPVEELQKLFDDAGIDLSKPVTTSCGSGITACIASFALEMLGHKACRVYDGSWTEWGGRDDTPITV